MTTRTDPRGTERKIMRVAIVDDEQEVRETLTAYLSRYGEENKLTFDIVPYSSGDAFLSSFEPVYDIIIFDIDMPGTNGLDTARQVRALDKNVVILFVTNIAQYAINGYEVEAIDYIIKPIGYYDFSLKFTRAVKKAAQTGEKRLILNTTEGIVTTPVSHILYVEVMAHYLRYQLGEGSCQVRGSLKEQEGALLAYHFSRTHKSFLVNLSRITRVTASEVFVGDHCVPLGRAYKQKLMEDYMSYLRGE